MMQLDPLDRLQNLKFQKSNVTAAAILKNQNITISRPRLERFRRDLAWQRSSAF